MFRTYKHAEIPTSTLFDDEAQLWRYVEHGLHRPWFYVTLAECHEGLTLRNMLMVADVRTLEILLAEQHHDMKIEAVQLVSPGYINKSSRWMMEPLAEVAQVSSANAGPPIYIYSVEGEKQYVEGDDVSLLEERINARRVIYKACA